jgi:secreted trypsin-like serine protease
MTPKTFKPKEPRIVGGKPATMGQFPYQVKLLQLGMKMIFGPLHWEINSRYDLCVRECVIAVKINM